MRIRAYFAGAVVVTGVALAGFSPAWAVDLVNTDSVPYDIVVEENGETFRFSIGPQTNLSGVCSACTVRLSNGKKADAEDNDTVTIRQGQPVVGG